MFLYLFIFITWLWQLVCLDAGDGSMDRQYKFLHFLDIKLNLLAMNPVSFRTKNENLLRTKTKSFKDNLKQTEARIKSSSSLNNLAGKLYSPQINKDFSPSKQSKGDLTISRHNSTSKLSNGEGSFVNPEANQSVALTGLSLRASHVPCFAELNTDLLKEKKMLESRINSLKEAIALEKRTLSKADYNAKKNEAGNNNFNDMYNEAHKKSLHLQNQINNTNQDNYNLRRDVKNLRENIDQRNKSIAQETTNCNDLQNQTKNLKISCMQEEKQKNTLKAELSKQQRVMNSDSIHCKELQNERAMLLIEINQSVKSFKL